MFLKSCEVRRKLLGLASALRGSRGRLWFVLLDFLDRLGRLRLCGSRGVLLLCSGLESRNGVSYLELDRVKQKKTGRR